MIRIGIDTFEWATFPYRGIGRYECNLVQAMARLCPPDVEILSLHPGIAPPSGMPDGVAALNASPGWTTLKARKLSWMLSHVLHRPLDGRLGHVDVFHSPDMAGPGLAATPLVVTVHDLAPWLYPETRTVMNSIYLEATFRRSLSLARRVIVDSDSVGRELTRMMGVPPDKVVSIPLAAAAVFSMNADSSRYERLRGRLGLDKSFFMAVGTIEPRKNHGMLFDAFDLMCSNWTGGSPMPQLLVVGLPGWKHDGILRRLRRMRSNGRVILAGAVDDDDLCQLYAHCAALVYPSLYEGFGLPMLEAMSCGAPVIASNIPVLVEVAGDAALFVDPGSVRTLAEAMLVSLDPDRRGDLIGRGLKRCGMFSWDDTARRTLQVYREVAAEGNAGA